MNPDLIKVLKKLDRLFKQEKINYVLVGALVPQILIDMQEKDGHGYGIRKTIDVDFVVNMKSWEGYEYLMDRLEKAGLEKRSDEPEHRLFMDGIAVDLVPYDPQILKEDQTLIWPRSGNRMKMAGYQFLFRYARSEDILNEQTIQMAPLPLIVYCKCLAFQDRKFMKDLVDILYILAHYEELTVSDRRIMDDIPDRIPLELRGAYLLGMDLVKLDLPADMMQTLKILETIDEGQLYAAESKVYLRENDGQAFIHALMKGAGLT